MSIYHPAPTDDKSPKDPEQFCSDCLAGMESSEHHEKCVAPYDDFAPPLRELADGIAAYVQSFMSCVDSIEELRDLDYQFMADDFVESCVIGVMQIDGGDR